jgi:peptide chain release factor 3
MTVLHAPINPVIEREVRRRRTFAIISHPDAGKTTLTEKLLLFGGCIEVAGAVRGRKSQRAATSDWMELEKQRGISVTSTVLTFEFDGHHVNLLDTPGHHDFSEDTYRTLMAADCAVMVIDLAKGIEAQTEKLFHVCALRQIPVITFVNKVDRPGRNPLEILSEIESKFGIKAVPQNWPLGEATEFCGVIDLNTRTAELFEDRSSFRRIQARTVALSDLPGLPELPPVAVDTAMEEVELLWAAGTPFERQGFLALEQSPVFFGSALTNLGVEHFLRGFLALCPRPQDRPSDLGKVPAARDAFAGFVFKIQANLDPRHRDRIAFLRVCSGRFRRDMEVLHTRTGKKLRLPRAHRVFGRERETMDESFAGDIVGLVNPGEFRLGDTLCEGLPVNFEPLPQFSPENFAVLRCRETDRRKQFERGLQQLLEEGAIQSFRDQQSSRREPLLAAVGELQFDLVRFRLENEYDAKTDMEPLPYKLARWVDRDMQALLQLRLPSNSKVVVDQWGHPAVLFQSSWDATYAQRQNPEVRFQETCAAAATSPVGKQPT